MYKARFENNQLCIDENLFNHLVSKFGSDLKEGKHYIHTNSYFASRLVAEKLNDNYYKVVPVTSQYNERPILQLEAYWDIVKYGDVLIEGEVPIFYRMWFANRGIPMSDKRMIGEGKTYTEKELRKHIIKKKGRWGTYHYELDFQKGDYQSPNKITGNDEEEVIKVAKEKGLIKEDIDKKTKEELSDYAHETWSDWVSSIIKDHENEDGSITIPKERIDRWKELMSTDYEDLSKVEKDKDREQADKIIDVIDDDQIGENEMNEIAKAKLPHNKEMQDFLAKNGIEAIPKRIDTGSLRGRWRLYNKNVKWYGNDKLINKLNQLGFRDFDGKPLGNHSGNGGMFSVFVRAPKNLGENKMNEDNMRNYQPAIRRWMKKIDDKFNKSNNYVTGGSVTGTTINLNISKNAPAEKIVDYLKTQTKNPIKYVKTSARIEIKNAVRENKINEKTIQRPVSVHVGTQIKGHPVKGSKYQVDYLPKTRYDVKKRSVTGKPLMYIFTASDGYKYEVDPSEFKKLDVRQLIPLEEQKLSKLQLAYREFFRAKMEEFGIKSPVDLKTDEKRKEFWNSIKRDWPKAKRQIKEGVFRQLVRKGIAEFLDNQTDIGDVEPIETDIVKKKTHKKTNERFEKFPTPEIIKLRKGKYAGKTIKLLGYDSNDKSYVGILNGREIDIDATDVGSMRESELKEEVLVLGTQFPSDLKTVQKKAKLIGKAGKGWDKEYITNSNEGHVTTIWVNASNKDDAMNKIQNAKPYKGLKNVYYVDDTAKSFISKNEIKESKKDILRQKIRILIENELKHFIMKKGETLKKEGIPFILNQNADILAVPGNYKLMNTLENETTNMSEDEVSGGKGDKLTPEDVDPQELAVGIEVEREHTDSDKLAQEIALDHLAENPKYYTELVQSGIADEKDAIELAKKYGMVSEVRLNEAGKLNSDMFKFFVKELESQKKKESDPSKYFAGGLVYKLETGYQKYKNIKDSDWWNKQGDYAPNVIVTFKKAFEYVFGKGSYKILKDKNKKIKEISIDEAKKSNIDVLRSIVRDSQAKPVKFEKGGQLKIDLFSAGTLVKVYDAIKNQSTKEKMENMLNSSKQSFLKARSIAFQFVK